MSTEEEKINTNLDYEKVVQSLESYHSSWFGNGFRRELRVDENTVFQTPFEMIDYIYETGSDEEKYAAEVFEHTMLQNKIGYRYTLRLESKDPARYQECIKENANEDFWITREGRSLLLTYASQEGYLRESSISDILAKGILDLYLSEYKKLEDGELREERLGDLGTTLNRYFFEFGYAHLGFWSKEENVYAMYMFKKAGNDLPIEVIRSKHEMYTTATEEEVTQEEYVSNPSAKRAQFEKFDRILSVFECKGFVENNYEEFRASLIKKLQEPDIPSMVKEEISRRYRKYRSLEVLKQISEFAGDKDSRFNGIAREFLSNLAFDKDLFVIVDTLRRHEKDEKKAPKGLSFKYDEILDTSFENPKYLTWDWYRREGSNILRNMYEVSPYMYMDIVKRYVGAYCFKKDLTDEQRADIKKILGVLFSIDLKSKNKELHDRYVPHKEVYEKKKGPFFTFPLLCEEESKIKINENLEFFESTKEWSIYFKSGEFNRSLVELFNTDPEFFDFIIDSLMENAPSVKDKNYFDNVRMINIVGKRLEEQYRDGATTVEDYLGEERQQIEDRIMRDARRILTQPEIKFTVNLDPSDPYIVKKVVLEYFSQYSQIVDVLDLKDLRIITQENSLRISSKNISIELMDSIRGLGFDFEVMEDKSIVISFPSKEELINRVLGILISPTLFEWVEDDKNNDNPQNDRMRTLFFVPSKLSVIYKKDKRLPFMDTSFSLAQRKHFTQNYLQWYLTVKYTTGDVQSLNTVISSWFMDMPEMKQDAYNQREQISRETERVWKDLEEALAITFEYERFRKSDILKKLLLAVNIEGLVPLINNDRFQTSLLAASILRSALDIAKEESVFRGIMQASATLRNEFEGSTSITYLAQEKKERIERTLKKLGFTPTDDGLQMFRNIWVNFWYLRGNRGESQTLRITSAGIEISNPKRNMYEYERRRSETDPARRKYGGGQDKVLVSWAQIRGIEEVKIDLIPSKDIIVRLFTSFASLLKKQSRPQFISDIESQGPANIILKLPGRDEPICEIFAIHKPMEFWKLLKDFAKLMVDEEAAEDALELLKILQKN